MTLRSAHFARLTFPGKSHNEVVEERSAVGASPTDRQIAGLGASASVRTDENSGLGRRFFLVFL